MIQAALDNLSSYIRQEEYKGYDPYDALNSPLNFRLFGRLGPAVAIQVQKRNPINIRTLLGIRKAKNPKGVGLLLKAFCLLYQIEPKLHYKETAADLFEWLVEHRSTGFRNSCWGYNFDWANPGGYLKAFAPSIVVTSFVIDGIFEYYKTFNRPRAKDIILDSTSYILNDLPQNEFDEGLCFAYTHQSKGCCYNASLLGAETLAKAWTLSGDDVLKHTAKKAVDFCLFKQKDDGSWYYSYDPETCAERKQIDFHQGFVLVSLFNYSRFAGDERAEIRLAIKKGLHFYLSKQFYQNGRSKWRLPKEWPTDIHYQAQGIITFAKLRQFDSSYLPFAQKIAEWTINNMQNKRGYFYYQKHKCYTNRIPYMRWGQAWMLLALAELQRTLKDENNEAGCYYY